MKATTAQRQATSPLEIVMPAFKNLGTKTELTPCIVVDSREQDPLPIQRLKCIRAGLQTGDYSIRGLEHLFSIERKTIPDLVACCCGSNRERFERELHRLRGFRFARLLVVGSRETIERGEFRSNIRPAAALGTLHAFEARYIPVVFEPDIEAAARLIELWAWYFCREITKQASCLFRGLRQGSDTNVEQEPEGSA